MIRKTLLLLCSMAVLASCDNDIDITADWKDVPVIYGVLDVNEPVQYVKLNKAFLGQGDVMMMAQEFDSLHYNVDLVEVRLLEQKLEWVDSLVAKDWVTKKVIELEPTTEFDKPEGVFSSPSQIIYKTEEELNKDRFYAIEVFNVQSDSVVAYTDSPVDLLPSIQIVKPNIFSPLSITSNGYTPKVEWSSVEGGKLYELKMRFNYIEHPILDPSDTVHKFIEWTFPRRQSLNVNGGENMSFSIDNEQFLNFLSANIDEDQDMRRQAVGMQPSSGSSGFSISHSCLDFTLYAAGEELTTYILLNGNSSSIVVERPNYTNIENGIGIFSSRTKDIVSGVKITNATNDEIAQSEITKHLNFAYYILSGDNEIDTLYVN